MNLKGRSFLKLIDYTPEEIEYLIDLAAKLKAEKKQGILQKDMHSGKNIVLIFEKLPIPAPTTAASSPMIGPNNNITASLFMENDGLFFIIYIPEAFISTFMSASPIRAITTICPISCTAADRINEKASPP